MNFHTNFIEKLPSSDMYSIESCLKNNTEIGLRSVKYHQNCVSECQKFPVGACPRPPWNASVLHFAECALHTVQ